MKKFFELFGVIFLTMLYVLLLIQDNIELRVLSMAPGAALFLLLIWIFGNYDKENK